MMHKTLARHEAATLEKQVSVYSAASHAALCKVFPTAID